MLCGTKIWVVFIYQGLSKEEVEPFTFDNYTVFVMEDATLNGFMFIDQDHLKRSHWGRRNNIATLMK